MNDPTTIVLSIVALVIAFRVFYTLVFFAALGIASLVKARKDRP